MRDEKRKFPHSFSSFLLFTRTIPRRSHASRLAAKFFNQKFSSLLRIVFVLRIFHKLAVKRLRECRRVVGDSIRRRMTVRFDEKNITIVNVNCDDLATNWLTYIKFIWLVCLKREISSDFFYELIYDSIWLRPIGINVLTLVSRTKRFSKSIRLWNYHLKRNFPWM